MHKNEQTNYKIASRVEVAIKGTDLFLYEHISHNMIEKILKKLREDFGLKLKKRCRSVCG